MFHEVILYRFLAVTYQIGIFWKYFRVKELDLYPDNGNSISPTLVYFHPKLPPLLISILFTVEFGYC